jgi:hypothetical protein
MTTSNETLNFEHAYIEMRNLLAYTLNVIAGEISDGVTPIDDGVKRRQQAYDIVCSQTHALHKSVHPTTLEQHDELIKKFEHYLTFVSCHPDLGFTDKHPELNKIRYRDFYDDVDNEETHLIEEPKKTNISVIRNLGILLCSLMLPFFMLGLGGYDFIIMPISLFMAAIIFVYGTNKYHYNETKHVHEWLSKPKNITRFILDTTRGFFSLIANAIIAVCVFLGILYLFDAYIPREFDEITIPVTQLFILLLWAFSWANNAHKCIKISKAYE